MQKKALVTGLINTGFIGAGVGSGAKKFKQALKKPEASVHDVILKNKTPKVETPDVKAASIIDNLYMDKVAYTPDEIDTEDYDPKNKGKGSLVPKGIGAVILGTYLASALSHGGNFVKPLRHAGSVVKDIPSIFVDKVLRKRRGGKVIADAIKHYKAKMKEAIGVTPKTKAKMNIPQTDPKKAFDNVLSAMLLGGGLAAGNLGVHIIGDKYFDNKNLVRKSYDNTIPSFSNNHKESYHYKLNQKKASELIDETFEKKAYYKFSNKAHFIKKLLKQDLAQNAVGTLPFFALPATASYLAGRDLKYDARKISKAGKDKITIDIPLSDFKKTAGFRPRRSALSALSKGKKSGLYQIPTWKEFFKYEMPSRAVRTLSWVAPATALTAITGRNIRGSLEKTDSKVAPLEPGKARVTIETAPTRDHDIDPRYASNIIDGMYKEAIAVQVKKNEIKV